MTSMGEQIKALHDFAVDHPAGFTSREAMTCLGIDYRSHYYEVVQHLRDALATEGMTLICDSTQFGQLYIYRLVGTFPLARPCANRIIRGVVRRLITVRNILLSVLQGTDGRSSPARAARILERHVSRALEDLAELDDQLSRYAAHDQGDHQDA